MSRVRGNKGIKNAEKRRFLYLASQSARRSDILREMALPFEVVRSRYREDLRSSLKPEELVVLHALGKAEEAELPERRRKPGCLILGADTIVYFNGRSLGKPHSYHKAALQLGRMAGRTHYVYTGIALVDPLTGRSVSGFSCTKVRFRRWGKKKIESYVREIKALDKAGGYAIQSEPCIVASYEGSLTNVIGLPKELLRSMLKGFGF